MRSSYNGVSSYFQPPFVKYFWYFCSKIYYQIQAKDGSKIYYTIDVVKSTTKTNEKVDVVKTTTEKVSAPKKQLTEEEIRDLLS